VIVVIDDSNMSTNSKGTTNNNVCNSSKNRNKGCKLKYTSKYAASNLINKSRSEYDESWRYNDSRRKNNWQENKHRYVSKSEWKET
jgi:hypothetical protein